MSKKTAHSNISYLREIYQNKWVAFTHDEKEIIAADRSFNKAIAKANKKGEKNPVMFKVPPKTECLVL